MIKKITILLLISSALLFSKLLGSNENKVIKDRYGNLYKKITSPHTGKIWLDRNLGASRVCISYNDISCYGGYFQWGRDADGHEKKDSATTSKVSNKNKPNHNKFIKSSFKNRFDWLRYKDNSLWGGKNNTNNPCPKKYRVPTIDEILAETVKQGVKSNRDAFNSFLKLPFAGYRRAHDGSMEYLDSWGNMWSSSAHKKHSRYLFFHSGNTAKNFNIRANGFSIRCIKN